MKKKKKKIFPTRHPYVSDPKTRQVSNVRLATFSFGGEGGEPEKHYALPTMIRGIQRSNNYAVDTAKKHGLDKYPSFDRLQDAEAWIEKNHGNINPRGRLKRKKGTGNHPLNR